MIFAPHKRKIVCKTASHLSRCDEAAFRGKSEEKRKELEQLGFRVPHLIARAVLETAISEKENYTF